MEFTVHEDLKPKTMLTGKLLISFRKWIIISTLPGCQEDWLHVLKTTKKKLEKESTGLSDPTFTEVFNS
jgi:hypothetical protein